MACAVALHVTTRHNRERSATGRHRAAADRAALRSSFRRCPCSSNARSRRRGGRFPASDSRRNPAELDPQADADGGASTVLVSAVRADDH